LGTYNGFIHHQHKLKFNKEQAASHSTSIRAKCKRASAGVIRIVNPRPEKYQPLPFAYIPYIFHTLTHAQNT